MFSPKVLCIRRLDSRAAYRITSVTIAMNAKRTFLRQCLLLFEMKLVHIHLINFDK